MTVHDITDASQRAQRADDCNWAAENRKNIWDRERISHRGNNKRNIHVGSRRLKRDFSARVLSQSAVKYNNESRVFSQSTFSSWRKHTPVEYSICEYYL